MWWLSPPYRDSPRRRRKSAVGITTAQILISDSLGQTDMWDVTQQIKLTSRRLVTSLLEMSLSPPLSLKKGAVEYQFGWNGIESQIDYPFRLRLSHQLFLFHSVMNRQCEGSWDLVDSFFLSQRWCKWKNRSDSRPSNEWSLQLSSAHHMKSDVRGRPWPCLPQHLHRGWDGLARLPLPRATSAHPVSLPGQQEQTQESRKDRKPLTGPSELDTERKEGRKEAYLCHSFLKENGRSNDRIGVPHAPR